MYLDIEQCQHVMSDGVENLEKLPDVNTLNQTNSSLPHTRTIETPPRRVKKLSLSATELGTYVYRKGLSTCLDPLCCCISFWLCKQWLQTMHLDNDAIITVCLALF